jgi:hypothetical protein
MSNSWHSKHPMKAPKSFKEIQKRKRKAKIKNALRVGKEPPDFKKSDTYDYN